MIKDIKYEGFDKSRQAIEESIIQKRAIESRVAILKNSIRVSKDQRKLYGTHNTKLINESDRLTMTGNVKVNYI